MTMVLFTSVAIVREKERGNLELMINTPIKTPELMLGKISPYILVGLIQLVLVLGLGWYFFQVPIRGSLLHVLAAALVFIAATQFQAMQMAFFFFLPSILISGFMFPFDGMPAAAQNITEFLPLTHFNRLIRGIVLRGADITSMLDELLALAIFTAVAFTLAILRFNKRLD
jgi:ABC-2 type transport system permease protein